MNDQPSYFVLVLDLKCIAEIRKWIVILRSNIHAYVTNDVVLSHNYYTQFCSSAEIHSIVVVQM